MLRKEIRDGENHVVSVEHIVIPLRYWFAFFGPWLITVVSVVSLHFNSVSKLEKYVRDVRSEHETKEHVAVYKGNANDTANGRFMLIDQRLAIQEQLNGQLVISVKNVEKSIDRLIELTDVLVRKR